MYVAATIFWICCSLLLINTGQAEDMLINNVPEETFQKYFEDFEVFKSQQERINAETRKFHDALLSVLPNSYVKRISKILAGL